MKKRFSVGLAVLVLALAGAGSAFGFDCIRVSSSLQGLQQSTRSGNWLLFDFSTPEAVQETFATIDETITEAEAECFAEVYGASGQPLYFALGIGVAGPNGVLAFQNDNASMGDDKGIDHLEQSGIFGAFEEAAAECEGAA